MRYYGICIALLICSFSRAQEFTEHPGLLFPDNEEHLAKWFVLRGSFLEADRFDISYDKTPQRLMLQAGYGNEFIRLGKTNVGAEILVWSGLKTLTGFRFPVETADYFFGLYSVSPLWIKPLGSLSMLRTRLSHISSHYVDGTTDTIVGGSSSRFSREFVSLEILIGQGRDRKFMGSAGVKYVFHQVNKNEPIIQFPVVLNYRLLRLGKKDDIFAYASTAAGPALPVFAGGIVFSHVTSKEQALEIYAEYHNGHSRYGVDGNMNENGFQFGVRLLAQ
jgi:hypothetical protein